MLRGRGPEGETVGIIIPTHNRSSQLDRQLEILTTLFAGDLSDGKARIWVLDDASSDNTPAVCAKYGTQIKCRRSDVALGAIEARRRLFELADTSYLLHLDDDSWPLQPDALEVLRAFFNSSPSCAIVAGNIATSRTPCGLLPTDASPFRVGTFVGCACAVRSEALIRAGGYPPFLSAIQAEEQALSLRMIDAGYDIVALPSLRFFHADDPRDRPVAARRAATLANEVAIVVACFPAWLVAPATAYKIGSALGYNLTQGTLRPVAWLAVRQIPRAMRAAKRHRQPARLATILRFRLMQAGFNQAVRRHLASRPGPWPEVVAHLSGRD